MKKENPLHIFQILEMIIAAIESQWLKLNISGFILGKNDKSKK